MSSEKLFARIPLLTRENYHTWKIGISAFLREHESLGIVTGTTTKPTGDDDNPKVVAWELKNAKALNYITLSISEDHYRHIESCTTGTEAWTALKNKYEKSGRSYRVALKHQLYNCKHDPDRPIQDYIDEVITVWRRLTGIGVRLEETDIVDVFLFNLHESWASAAASLCIGLKENAVVADVEGALRDEERRQRRPIGIDEAANLAKGGRGRKAPSASRGHTSGGGGGPTCHRCQGRGHIAKYCTAPAPVAEADETPGETSHLAYLASIREALPDF